MSSYETSSLTEIEAVLDGLTNATSAQVYDATRGYSPKALASVAASRADAAGGGGGGEGAQLLGPAVISYNTPNVGVADYPGATLFAVETGQWILDVWVKIVQDFDFGTMYVATDGANPTDILGAGWDVTGSPDTTVGSGDLGVQTQTGADAAATTRLDGSRNSSNFQRLLPAEVLADVNLTAYIDFGVDTPSQGVAHIYAVVVTPT